MTDLIEALQILAKYLSGYDAYYPTCCEHDILYVAGDPDAVTAEDKERLSELGFDIDEETNSFHSFKFGSR